jgi:8-oxo-dGTP pyrophosphatase MutT (NUDIX family)
MAGPATGLTMGEVRATFATGPAALDAGEATGAPGAAVLIVLGPFDGLDEGDEPGMAGDGLASVLLIRRAAHLRANPAEIAFPGGRIEPGESPLAAALREAEEEVALPAGAVDVLGELPMVLASRREVPILPFVAMARGLPALEANPDEVDGLLVVQLRELVAPGRYWQERWDRGDDPAWVMHFFDLGEDVIWGATARMLHELFLRLLSRGSGGRTGGPPGARTRPASRWTRAAS